ncbi:MAG: S8 family serine peptidase, partial [Anaerolineae bacterium]|nr:S8 family serine peptidase [Anaerolineae bacterium]
MAGFVSGFSSRGPSIAGNILKPDVSAPGSNIVSAGAGEGTGPATLSGTSMAAPHIAGVLALVKQAHPTWTGQEVEAAVTNTANPIIRDLLGLNPDDTPRTVVVPISRQGAGLVDAYKAVKTTTVAYAPNQVGSVSFGFKAVVNTSSETKTFIVSNKGTTERTYNLQFAFQDPSVAPAGSTVTVSPSTVTLPAGATQAVTVTMTIVASGLPPYGLSNAAANNPTQLTRSELSGFVRITEQGGAGDAIAVPIYALARRASAVDASTNSLSLTGFGAEDAGHITLTNTSAYSGTAEIFALVGSDPNEADIFDSTDVQYVGVRSGSFTSSGTTRQLIEFGIKTYGPRTLPLENEFDINIDVNRDGIADYVGFNYDVGAFTTGTSTGQNATFIYNMSTRRFSGPYYITQALVNSSNMILTFNAADLGITSDNQAFNFWVEAYTTPGFEREEWDRAPDSGVYTYNARDVRFRLAPTTGDSTALGGTVVVAPNSSRVLTVYANARGFLGGDTTGRFPEKGMLLLYTENVPPDRDADIVNLTFPFNFRVERQTLSFNAALSGYVVNRPGELGVQFGVGDLWTGVDNRPIRPLVYHGITHFNLGTAGSTVEFEEAVLELTGLDASYMSPALEGRWGVDMLTSAVDPNLGRTTFSTLATADADARLTPTLTDSQLGVGTPNVFTFDAAARAKLQEHVRTSGRVTFRTWEDPLYQQGMQLFAWDGRGGTGADIRPPVLRVLTVTRIP